jgi:hypothetical protein
MARPRIFVSSTFYDLKQIRADVFRFITEMGYEPVLHERGKVPYGKEKSLEEYCYKEIEGCDILVSIVGGRFGSGSLQKPYSISQLELKTAFEQEKQVFIFIERAVYSEYSTYLKNKGVLGIQYHFVDNPSVYSFIEEIEQLPRNNPISPFETAQDITDYLREQWAGLFQRFLEDKGRLREIDLIGTLSASTKTLDQLVSFLTEERKNSDQAIRDILLTNHPVFEQMRQITSTPYRLFFTTRKELVTWLQQRGYKAVNKDAWDDAEHEEYIRDSVKPNLLLKIRSDIFDNNGKLKIYTKPEWKAAWVKQREHTDPEDASAAGTS